MAIIDSKYKIYGRKKGRSKKKHNLDTKFTNGILIKDIILNQKDHNILDIGYGSGENAIHLSKLFPKSKILACETFLDGNLNLCREIFINNIKNILIYKESVLKLY